MPSKHEFALFVDQVSNSIASTQIKQEFKLINPDLAHRIANILRFKQGEQFVLFDRINNYLVELKSIIKKEVQILLINKQGNKILTPSITFALPLLKREDFETALYSLVELGANKIQIITTEKTQRAWGQEKEFERCQRILIAASEQSKNFAFPELLEPVKLTSFLSQMDKKTSFKVFFDVHGKPCLELINDFLKQKPQGLVLMAGPEGDLTDQEKQLVKEAGFEFCVLTPTVLRSVSAIQLGMGIFRSFLR
jgi:RsmE family RNA methyltransferase